MDESMGEDVSKSENKLSYEEKAQRASIISKPMASKKLAKKLSKLIRKGKA
jgi:hypothetical protein